MSKVKLSMYPAEFNSVEEATDFLNTPISKMLKAWDDRLKKHVQRVGGTYYGNSQGIEDVRFSDILMELATVPTMEVDGQLYSMKDDGHFAHMEGNNPNADPYDTEEPDLPGAYVEE